MDPIQEKKIEEIIQQGLNPYASSFSSGQNHFNPTPNEILQTILTYENETISDTKQIDLSK